MARDIESVYDLMIQVDRKIDLHIQECRLAFDHIADLDEKQNMLLEEHMARSDALEALNSLTKKELEDRVALGQESLKTEIALLKKPQEARQYLYKTVLALAALLAAIAVIQDKTKIFSLYNL